MTTPKLNNQPETTFVPAEEDGHDLWLDMELTEEIHEVDNDYCFDYDD